MLTDEAIQNDYLNIGTPEMQVWRITSAFPQGALLNTLQVKNLHHPSNPIIIIRKRMPSSLKTVSQPLFKTTGFVSKNKKIHKINKDQFFFQL